MRKITFLLFLSLSCVAYVSAQNSAKTENKVIIKETVEREKFDPARNPAEDLKNAVANAQKENKRIILDVGGEWCVWCRWMDEFFIKNPELAKLRDENFVWLKVNMSEENENTEFLSAYPKAEGYPHLYILESDGTFLHSQGTSVLEDGKKSYDLQKYIEFLQKWSPEKAAEKSGK